MEMGMGEIAKCQVHLRKQKPANFKMVHNKYRSIWMQGQHCAQNVALVCGGF